MNPIVMLLILIVALAVFGFSAMRRWRLMMIGKSHCNPARLDQIGIRIQLTLQFAFGQKRLTKYILAGLAHKAIFFGFLVLMLRSLILFARGFVDDSTFGYWVLNNGTWLGDIYSLIKDIYIILVVLGTFTFLYLRLVKKLKRMTLSIEGIVILGIILVMMIADVTYDAAQHVLSSTAGFDIWSPLGSTLAFLFASFSDRLNTFMSHAGFWTHVCLVLVFLNILPYSKHFHIITAIPNVFLQDLELRGRLSPLEDIEGKIEREETLGLRFADQLSWKDILDLYTCTECGRCSDQCPASITGKLLSPKMLTIDLRDYLYQSESSLTSNNINEESNKLIPTVVNPEMIWACTTCGACEEECPVFITYVDKIVDMRRNLVMEEGDFPAPLQEAFQSLEVTGSPYGASSDERLGWAAGIDVQIRGNVDDVDILFWVGCAPATDERAKGIACAVAKLLNHAGIKWAVLGTEEQCTGDAARRAGNEYLFQTLAQANIELLNSYNTKRILTVCPHCYNTLKNEYPDFGGKYEVIHHADYLAKLVSEGKIKPTHEVNARIAYHDSCYLGRYNDIYDSPRDLLASIPGVTLVEAEASRDRGMCCGAGGAQMFKEEESGEKRVNITRMGQLLETGAESICTACPFCMRMLGDALNTSDKQDIAQQDIAEVLAASVFGDE